MDPSPELARGDGVMFKSYDDDSTGKTVARVNGTVLTDHDLLREMIPSSRMPASMAGSFPQRWKRISVAAPKQSSSKNSCSRRRGRNLKVPSVRLDRAVKAFRDQFGSANEFRAYLKEECGGSNQKLREKMRRSIMIDDLLLAEVAQKAVVTEAEVRASYQKNPASFFSPETVSLQTISIGIPDKPTPQQEASTRKRAEDALRQAKVAKNYEQFGMLAEKLLRGRLARDDGRPQRNHSQTDASGSGEGGF